MIAGVKTKSLKVIPDERGRVMELLRNDDEIFIQFGQIYMTTAYPGVVKGWHYHKKQTDTFFCLKGMLKVVLYDNREDSVTQGEINEFFIGEHNHLAVQIPNGVIHGFKCVSETEALVINVPTEPFDYQNPDSVRVDPHSSDIPYSWERKDG